MAVKLSPSGWLLPSGLIFFLNKPEVSGIFSGQIPALTVKCSGTSLPVIIERSSLAIPVLIHCV